MVRRIRVIQEAREPTFSERLEARARRIVNDHRDSASSVIKSTVRELAMTLSQIESLRAVHCEVRASLLQEELFIDTQIIWRTPRDPVYLDPRLPERDMLRSRLMQLEAERRRHRLSEERERRGLQDQMGALLNRWSMLQIRI